MRILLVTDWNRGHGGAEAYIASLRESLIAAGDQVRLMTSSAGTMGNGMAEYVAFGTEQVIPQTLLQIANPSAVYQARKALREFHPDVTMVNMFAHHLSPAVLHALRGVPIVLLVSDYKCICPIGSKLRPDETLCEAHAGWGCHTAGCLSLPHWLRDQPRYALIRSGIDRAECVISCSDWVQKALQSEQIQSERVYLAVPGAGLNYRREPTVSPTFLFCGRFDVEKGVDRLIRAFAKVSSDFPDSRLRIAGRGPLLTDLESLAIELGMEGCIDFLGWLEPAEVEEELSRTWALVAPSLWAEPLGLVAVEAIVRGVPVIATASGGFAETVEEGVTGFLVPNGDTETLAQRMRDIASGRVFPDHVIPADAVGRMTDRHSFARHVPELRGIFERAAAAKNRTARTAS